MNDEDYKYDVAFSFLEEDEDLATDINDLIQDRVTTFIYSRKQAEIAGTDGEETFNRVFGSEARTVFVLYREGWGKTPWTRIEETAIRNRAYDEGYDFVTFMPLDKPATAPQYLPKTRIWYDIGRYGIKGAVIVIEARVQEAGSRVSPETPEEYTARIQREIDDEKERQVFLNSKQGVDAAREEASRLFSEVAQLIAKDSQKGTGIILKYKQKGLVCAVYGGGFSIHIYWENRFFDTLKVGCQLCPS